jgi:glutathione S-transferase
MANLATVTQVSRSIGQTFAVPMSFKRRVLALGGFTASGLRFAAGIRVRKVGARPEQMLTLWDRERCPHCRIVREALSVLDLDANLRPVPKGGSRFEPGPVPRLEDPNAGLMLQGSQKIVAHLYDRYGNGKPPRLINATPVRIATGIATRILTGGRGAYARPSRAPEKPLELWSFEASPWCQFARFALCELELPYVLHNIAKGSAHRKELVARAGRVQAPYLFDPNTGEAMFESAQIENYLEKTYGAAP